MDATYCTTVDAYKCMHLVCMTCNSQFFSIEFFFVDNERTPSYRWLLAEECFHHEDALPFALACILIDQHTIFPGFTLEMEETNFILCWWHRENNIKTNCLKRLRTEKFEHFIQSGRICNDGSKIY